MAIIDKIQLSGTVYTIGNETTTAVTSASTDNEIPTAKAVYDAIPTGGTGGGKAVAAGRGISITTGETADTVSFNLPISAGTGTNSLIVGYNTSDSFWKPTASGKYSIAHGEKCSAIYQCSIATGYYNEARANHSIAQGYHTTTYGGSSHSEGWDSVTRALYSHAEGNNCITSGESSHAEGIFTNTSNKGEHSEGWYNVTRKNSATFGDSGNTLFSVGNGTADNARHNAFEIRQNGDIYISLNGQDVKLQDQLGGGGSSYTAGDGIDITNDVISVSGVSHNSLADGTKMLLKGDVTSVGQNYSTIGFNYYYGTSSNKNSITIKPLTINGNSALRTQALSISVVETSAITTAITSSSTDAQVPSAKAVNDKLGGLSLVKLTQAEYDALATKDSNVLYVIVG